MKIEITKPTIENAKEISNLFSTVITHTFKKEKIFNPIELQNEIKIQILNFRACLEDNDNLFLVAKFEDEIIATISYAPISELIQENTGIDASTFEMKSVYVLPKFHNKGIGSQIYKEMLKSLKATKAKQYCLDSGYHLAQNFWTKKLGEPFKVLENYWGKGMDHKIWLIKL